LVGRSEIDPERAIFPAVLRPAFRARKPLRRMALQGDTKWVEGHEHFGDEDGFLFDLAQDPGELNNLRETQRKRFDELAELAAKYEAGLDVRLPLHQRTGVVVPVDGVIDPLILTAEEKALLDGLGYTGDDDEHVNPVEDSELEK